MIDKEWNVVFSFIANSLIVIDIKAYKNKKTKKLGLILLRKYAVISNLSSPFW